MGKITNTKQHRTIERIFEDKPQKNILWRDVVSLFEHLGYRMYGTGGSRVCFKKEGFPPFHMHRPHPSNHLPPEAVTEIRKYLEQIGVTP